MEDLTKGPISGHLFKTASFMLVTMVFQTLYFLVDLYWVGRLGKEAVAGVGVAGNLTFIVLAISQMLGVGTTTLVSHAAGQRNQDRALLVFNQSQLLSMLVGAVFLLIAMIFRTTYANALSADAGTAQLASAYLLWFLPAMGLQFGLVAMGAALRGIGSFKPGMIVQTATVVINIALAPILMFGWGTGRPMGVAGTAMASLIAVAVGVGWLATYFVGTRAYLRFLWRDMKPQFKLWRDMLKIGLPAGAEFGLMAVYLMIVYVVTRPFGSAAQAGFGIGMRIVQALFMPIVALGFAVAPVAGQNFGARQAHRVKAVFKTASTMAAIAMFVAAVVCNIAPQALIRIFSGDPGVIAVGDEYLRIISWNFVASGLIFVASSMFQAMGNTIPSLLASFSRLGIIAIPVLLLSRLSGFELRWIWYLSVVAILIQLTIILLLLRREFRLRLDTMPSAPLADSAPAIG
ncbi:MAG: MATE family efflux transporter [Vicinamibacterales bacterium]